jgi:hypothetical protein
MKYSWHSFLLEAESTSGHRAAGRIRITEKLNDLAKNQNHDLLAYSIVPQSIILQKDSWK